MTLRGGAEPLSETPAFVANRKNPDTVPKSEVDTKLSLVNEKKVQNKANRQKIIRKKQASRVAELKRICPDMKGIPTKLGAKRKAKLIAEYQNRTARAAETASPAPLPAASGGSQIVGTADRKTPTKKGRSRARALRKEYPDMRNIPDSIDGVLRHKLIKDHLSRQPSILPPKPREKVGKHVVPPRKESARLPSKPQDTSYLPEQRQQIKPPTGKLFQRNATRPISSKMAPLSDERRAEVARNLKGTSNDDPINLD